MTRWEGEMNRGEEERRGRMGGDRKSKKEEGEMDS